MTHVNAARRIGLSRAGTAQAKPSCDNGTEVHERASPNSMRLAAAIARKKQSSPARRLARPPPSNFEPAPPRYYLHAPIIGALASQARHDSRPQSLMIRGVLSPGL
ncbi:hypothetical protein, partial [Burkholderia pseudomallei]